MTILSIDRNPDYWKGRRAVRVDLADHGDQTNHDALVAAEYDQIIAGLGTGVALEAIPEYAAVADRRMVWAPVRAQTVGFDELDIPGR